MSSTKIKTKWLPLSELNPGDCAKEGESRRRWFKIIRIGGVQHRQGTHYIRMAYVVYLGGRDAGNQGWVSLSDYPKGYEVATEPLDLPNAEQRITKQAEIFRTLLEALPNAVKTSAAGVTLTMDQADTILRWAWAGKVAEAREASRS